MPVAAERAAPTVRFPELRDPAWWQTHGLKTDLQIAIMLGCSRETARLARQRIGHPSLSRGRPRGGTVSVIHADQTVTTETMIVLRMQREWDLPGESAAPTRIRAVHEARLAGNPLDLEEAVEATAVAFGLWLKQLRRARGAEA